MADFFQTGAIATLHRLGKQDVMRLERELGEFAQETRIGLVLPCHVKELGTPALRQIMRELRHVSYLRQIVVGILREFTVNTDVQQRQVAVAKIQPVKQVAAGQGFCEG